MTSGQERGFHNVRFGGSESIHLDQAIMNSFCRRASGWPKDYLSSHISVENEVVFVEKTVCRFTTAAKSKKISIKLVPGVEGLAVAWWSHCTVTY